MRPEILLLVLRKVGGLVLTLFLASVAIFSALMLSPGDPVSALLGGSKPTPAVVAEIRAEYHLDDPLWLQYGHWVSGLMSGNLGRSFIYKSDVAALIAPRLEVTLVLVAYAAAILAVIGVGSGILAARKPRLDRPILLGTSLGVATPTFVVAILLVWIFSQTLGWFPVYGSGNGGLGDLLYHLTLPAISLAALFAAYVSRMTRTALVEQSLAEHVETATLRGVPRERIFRRHVLLNASPAILSVTALAVAGLFAAATVAEQAFGLSGVGALLTEAAARKDLPVVQALSMMLVAIFVVVNAAADVVTAIIDPSTTKSGRAS